MLTSIHYYKETDNLHFISDRIGYCYISDGELSYEHTKGKGYNKIDITLHLDINELREIVSLYDSRKYLIREE